MNNQNQSLTPEEQQQLNFHQGQQGVQRWNHQWNFNPQQYPSSLQQQVSFPPPIHTAPPPPPDVRPPEPSQSFVQSYDQSHQGNFNNPSNRGKTKQNWSRGNQQQLGGNRSGNFSLNKSGNIQQGNVRALHQNQGNFGSDNNQQNYANKSNSRPQFGRNPQQVNPQQTISPASMPSTAAQKSETHLTVQAMTQEEVEFDAQFRKWEQEFDSWKKANVHHPDKNAYRKYEQQFETVREKLLQRRTEMQKKKTEQQLLVHPPKTDTQRKFESDWIAGGSKVEESKKAPEPQPSTSKSLNISFPPPMENPEEFHHDNFDDKTYGDETQLAISKRSFKGIPGLDFIVSKPAKPKKFEPIITLEEEDYDEVITGPPPMAKFTPIFKRQSLDLRELLEEPGRSNRPEKILILIRGAPGSGKTYLAEQILKKEKSYGNNRCTNLNINKFYEGALDKSMIDKHQESIMYEFRSMIKAGFFNLVIIEVEGPKLMYFNKYVHIGITLGDFKCYVIEIYQTYDVCKKYQQNDRTMTEILEAVDEIERFQSPAKTMLLDPTYLLQVEKPEAAEVSVSNDKTNDLAANLAQLLQNKNVMELLQSELNKPKPLMSQTVLPPRHFPQPTIDEYRESQFGEPSSSSVYNDKQNQPKNTTRSGYSACSSAGPRQINKFLEDPFIGKTSFGPVKFDNLGNQNQFNEDCESFDDSYNPVNRNQPRFNQIHMNQQTSYHGSSNYDNSRNNQFNEMQGYVNPQMNLSQIRDGKENFNSNFIQQPPPDPTYEDVPTFTPAKITDYKHAHIPTLSEQLMEFKVFSVIDYKHRSTYKIQEFIRDVDVDKIIEKRKAIALRKKTLEYLRNAERPEDTVSNPTYPRGGWIVINQRERLPLKNKRKKKKTAKILRILASKDESWMTKGYDGTEEMELDDISSSDSMESENDFLELTRDAAQINISEQSGTLPWFNRFMHKKVMNIKSLLWNPERRSRPSRISIILRGAPGSGKSHLTQLIKKKENEMGNNSIRIVSINDYLSEDEDESNVMKTYSEQMLKLVENRMKDYMCTFIVIDAENCDLNFYHQFYQAGTSKGFTTYTVELYQTLETCLAQNIHKRPKEEIQAAIDTLDQIRIPSDHTLLLPIELYKEYNCVVNKKVLPEETKDELKDFGDDMEVDEAGPSCLVKESKIETSEPQEDETSKKKRIDFDWKLPEFNLNHRTIINIDDILEDPRRNLRSNRIMIVLRGPSGAGKSFLAALILAKEVEKKNLSAVILSIDDYFVDEESKIFKYNQSKVQTNITSLISNLKTNAQNNSINFIIIDAENIDLSVYNIFYNVGSSYGFKCYTIELFQSIEICSKNNQHDRSLSDIEKSLSDMKRFSIPITHTLLDPSSLYLNSKLPKPTEDRPLKSALRVSENIFALDPEVVPSSSEEIKEVEVKKQKDDTHEEFKARLKQLIMVKGEFIEKNIKPPKPAEFNWYNREIMDIRELLEEPGKLKRPDKIMIVLRGAPGSGKTFLAHLIERKEVENGNREGFKLLTIDDYFVTKEIREYENRNGMKCQGDYLKYDYDPLMLNQYMEKLVERFSQIAQDSLHKFVVVDGDCCDLQFYTKFFEIAKVNNYVGYTIELNQDNDVCEQYNDHKRENEIAEKNNKLQSMPTPDEHFLLDPEYLYNEYKYLLDEDEDLMDVSDVASEENFESDEELEPTFGPLKKTPMKSKWDDEADVSDAVIERLDGTRHKNNENLTMAAYLKNEDEWTMRPSFSTKKRVRWADIEEKKKQERMRDIGFIVGQTDWNRMTDNTDGKSALEKTKYIEPRKK